MTGKYFLDTNFLIYCFSNSEPEKQAKCIAILQQAQSDTLFVISTQVLNEFSAVMIGKFKQSPADIKAVIDTLSNFEVVTIDIPLIMDALDIHTLYHISFWDSLIISGAKAANCHTILSEDLQSGAKINGVMIQNPFLTT
jgi:predicted nucleic acid-binding protein